MCSSDLMLAAMALIFGAPLIGGLLNRKVIRIGKAATARILSMNDTGTYVNRNPLMRFTLEVQPEDGGPFQAETEKVIRQFAQLSVGSMVNVRYDPETLETAISD